MSATSRGGQPRPHALGVATAVWGEIGRLTTRHDWREGRKVDSRVKDVGQAEALTREEFLFLELAIRHLLYRLAVTEAGATPAVLLTKESIRNLIKDEGLIRSIENHEELLQSRVKAVEAEGPAH